MKSRNDSASGSSDVARKRPNGLQTAVWIELDALAQLGSTWSRCNQSAPRPFPLLGPIRAMCAAALEVKERVLEHSEASVHCSSRIVDRELWSGCQNKTAVARSMLWVCGNQFVEVPFGLGEAAHHSRRVLGRCSLRNGTSRTFQNHTSTGPTCKSLVGPKA